jgi:hypothetical protein
MSAMQPELENVVAILERRSPSPTSRYFVPGLRFNPAKGSVLVLGEEMGDWLPCGKTADLVVYGNDCFAFGIAVQVETETARSPWHRAIVTPQKDDGFIDVGAPAEHHLAPKALKLDLAVTGLDGTPIITRAAILPYAFLCLLNARFRRARGMQYRPQLLADQIARLANTSDQSLDLHHGDHVRLTLTN